jgi:hypothetical protein
MVVRLKDAVKLSDLASKVYKNLEPGKYVGNLAPSLGLVIQRDLGIASVEISNEFLDPVIFLSFTHFREPIKEALKTINTALQRGSEGIVFSLTHAMGLGKTHFLTILYHLYLNIPDLWESLRGDSALRLGIKELLKTLEDVNYKAEVAKRTLLIPIDLKYRPTSLTRYEALFEYLKRIIERKRAWLTQVVSERDLAELENLLDRLSKYKPKDAARAFVEALNRLSMVLPILILVDELYASVVEAILGESKDDADDLRSVLVFISSLVDDLKGKQPVVLVYASAQQDVQRWNSVKKSVNEDWAILLREAVGHFEDRMQRFSVKSVKEVTEEEALEIVKKRIVEFQDHPSKILREFNEIERVLANIVGQDIARRFMEKLKATYPFSPIYEEFVRKLVVPVYGGDFSNAQHLRDLIKISSSVLGKAIDDGESTLVSIAHIEHDDIKHCLQEDSAKLWWSNTILWNSYIDNKYQDPGEKKTLRYAVRSIYVKSVTDNVVDLIEMLRLKPETLTLETISRRALHQRDLILSLVGAVETNELGKLHRILDELENMPYIHVIRRDDTRYYFASFVSNPLQMISSIEDEILKRLRDQKGELDIAKAINYLREKLKDYMLVSQFKEKALLNFEFIKLGDFDADSFLKYLDDFEFTVLLISPLEIAEKVLLENVKLRDIIDKIKQSLERNRNRIKNLNMFAVVVPNVEKDSLEKILMSLVRIESSKMALNIFTSSEALNTVASQEIGRRKDLRDYMMRRGLAEEQLRRIVIDIVTKLKERLESFAQQLTTTSVQDFVSEYTSLFKTVISYDPVSESFVDIKLTVKAEGDLKDLEKVFASVPVWIANTIMAALNIKTTSDIKAQLESWIKGFLKKENIREELRAKGEYRLHVESIKETLIKGWSEIPIKPRSIKEIEVAIRNLSGVVIEDKVLGDIELKVEDNYLIIRRVKLIPPPPLPKGPRGIKGFTISGTNNVTIFLTPLAEPNKIRRGLLFEKIRSVHVHAELEIEEQETGKSVAVIEFKGPIGALHELAEHLVNYFNRHIDDIKQCNLQVELASEIGEEIVKQELKRIGISNIIPQRA